MSVRPVEQEFLIRFVLSALEWGAKKFFHYDTQLPAQMHYVDWQPRTWQVTSHVASTYWNRRMGGFIAGMSAWGVFKASSYLFPNSLGKKISDASGSLCSSLFSQNCSMDNPVVSAGMLGLLATGIGFGTTLAAGTYDLIQEYLEQRTAADLKPAFSDELQDTIDDLIDMTTSRTQKGEFYPHILFKGPPGTGKTMLSKWIARHSNMNYIYLSGPKLLDKKKTNSPVNALESIINHAKSLTSPTLIFIDEAESFCADRKTIKGTEGAELLDAFRELTGEPSSKVMFILATNSTETMDSAILNRLTRIFIPLPDLKTRSKIIRMHLPLFFNENTRKAIFSEKILNQIATATESLSGRSLLKLISRLSMISRREKLTNEVIEKTTQRFVRQEKEDEKSPDSSPG